MKLEFQISKERFKPVPSIKPRLFKWYSARQEIWRAEVRVAVQVRSFLLKFEILTSQDTNYKFVST